MEYTVLALCRMAGITPRTLRYYDEIGLLSPKRKEFTGYRIYGQAEVDRLQQILFYRELGIPLQAVREILDAPAYNALEELRKHREKMINEQKRLDALVRNISRTITSMEGEEKMTDTEKFEGFKQSLVDENEARYGAEIRQKYGDATVDASNRKLKGMSAEQYARTKELEEQIKEKLREAMQTGNAGGSEAAELAALHKEWLCMYWTVYSPEAHQNLAQMYTQDERFKAYYDDAVAPGAAEFLRDAIAQYVKKQRS